MNKVIDWRYWYGEEEQNYPIILLSSIIVTISGVVETFILLPFIQTWIALEFNLVSDMVFLSLLFFYILITGTTLLGIIPLTEYLKKTLSTSSMKVLAGAS